MKKIVIFIGVLAIFVSCTEEQTEPIQDISVSEVQAFFDLATPPLASRSDNSTEKNILWEMGYYRELPDGEALVFPLDFERDGFFTSSSYSAEAESLTYAFAYRQDEEIHLEYVQTIPTSSSELFSGYVVVSDWFGEPNRLFEYEQGEYVGKRSLVNQEESGRTACIEVTHWTCSGDAEPPSPDCNIDDVMTICSSTYDTFNEGLDGGGMTTYEPKRPKGGGSGGTTCNTATHETYNGTCVLKCDYGRGEDGICLSEADAWERDKITLSEKFKNDPCLAEIWEQIENTDAAFYLLNGFLAAFPNAELKIDVVTNSDLYQMGIYSNPWGSTQFWHQEIYLYLNTSTLSNSSTAFTASVLAHELLHASIFEELAAIKLEKDLSFNLDDFRDDFPGLFELWLEHGDIESATHQQIMENYITMIDSFIQLMDPNMDTEVTYALSWIGFDSTEMFNSLENSAEIKSIINSENEKGGCIITVN